MPIWTFVIRRVRYPSGVPSQNPSGSTSCSQIDFRLASYRVPIQIARRSLAISIPINGEQPASEATTASVESRSTGGDDGGHSGWVRANRPSKLKAPADSVDVLESEGLVAIEVASVDRRGEQNTTSRRCRPRSRRGGQSARAEIDSHVGLLCLCSRQTLGASRQEPPDHTILAGILAVTSKSPPIRKSDLPFTAEHAAPRPQGTHYLAACCPGDPADTGRALPWFIRFLWYGSRVAEPSDATTPQDSLASLAEEVVSTAWSLSADGRAAYFDQLGMSGIYRDGAPSRPILGVLGRRQMWSDRVRRRIITAPLSLSGSLASRVTDLKRSMILAPTDSRSDRAEAHESVFGTISDDIYAIRTGIASTAGQERERNDRVMRFQRWSFLFLALIAAMSVAALIPNLMGPSGAPAQFTFILDNARQTNVSVSGGAGVDWDLYLESDASDLVTITRSGSGEWSNACPVSKSMVESYRAWEKCGWRGYGRREGAGQFSVQLPAIYSNGAAGNSGHVTYRFWAPGSISDLGELYPEATSVNPSGGAVAVTWVDPVAPPRFLYTSPSAKQNSLAAATLLTLVAGFALSALFQIVPELLRHTHPDRPPARAVIAGVVAAVCLAATYLESSAPLGLAPIGARGMQVVAVVMLPLLWFPWNAVRQGLRVGPAGVFSVITAVVAQRPRRGAVPPGSSRRSTAKAVAAAVVGVSAAILGTLSEFSQLPPQPWIWSWGALPFWLLPALAMQVTRLVLLVVLIAALEPYLGPLVAVILAAGLTALSEYSSVTPLGLLSTGSVELHETSPLLLLGLALAVGLTAYSWRRWRKISRSALFWGLQLLILGLIASVV